MRFYRSALAGLVLAFLVQAAAAHLISGGIGSSPPPPTITGVTVTPGTFVGNSGDGTSTGAIAVTLSSGTFTGTLAIQVGGQGGAFRLSTTTLPSNLLLNGTQAAGPYTVNIVPTQAGLINSGTPFAVTITGTQAQQIASITPTSCNFTAGIQNGAVCNLTVTMSPTSPPSTAGLSISTASANSGLFHFVGPGCSNISSGTCTIEQSASAGGTPAGTYTDISAVATQSGISPFTQALTLTGAAQPIINSIGLTNSSFVAQAGNANSTIGTLSASVSSGSFGGTFTLGTQTGCVGANNSSFAISGTALKIGASDITTTGAYSVSVLATDATFGNSPKCMVLPLNGTAPGGVITTFTFQNDTGAAMSPGAPVSFGQGFRYDDITTGHYPVIRDASSHTAIPGQQWDEIATFRENGGDSSWRHAVWAIWLPPTSPQYTGGVLPAGATFQVEFVSTAGTYSQSSHQPLSALCSGPAAHALKIHLTDVRNQNDSVRDSGDATFALCSNINNTGRDAPRHVRAGNVYDEYIVSGMFVYATSGHNDPLLYVQAIVDIFTQASDGVSAGDVRWVFHIHNSWENVAAGTIGNAGNPGPVGFTNDPQMVSYRTEIDDGASDVLDWSGLDATVTSASNPIVSATANNCSRFGETVCLTVTGSTGPNTWFTGMGTRVSSGGTPVGGLTNGGLYWVWPSGSVGAGTNTNTQFVNFMPTPYEGEGFPMTNSQGAGTTTFSTRQTHWHWEAWQTLDATGLDNWSPLGTTTRVTRKVYPALITAEQRYWESTGIVVPVMLTQPTGQLGPAYAQGLGSNYEPFGQLNVIGGNGGGPRPDLGICNEWACKAFITQAQGDWDLARLFTFGSSVHGFSTMLDEATGSISPMNNGPPTGPGGNGSGTAYAGLGAFQNQANWLLQDAVQGLAQPLDFVPNASFHYVGGTNNNDTTLDHMPNFNGLTYILFGNRHFLDMMQWHGNKDFAQQRPGPGPELGQGFYRDNNAVFPGDGKTYHYWGIVNDSCFQGRGCAWLTRDVAYPATFGADTSPERQYFGDMLKETSNYWPIFMAFRDGPGSTGYSASIYPPGEPDTVGGAGSLMDSFVADYVSSVAFVLQTWQHLPMAATWNTKFQRYYEGVCGRQLAGATTIPSFYCIDFNLQPQVHDGSGQLVGFGGNLGQYMNGTDATDFGSFDSNLQILTGGQVAVNGYTVTAGDTLKMMWGWFVKVPPLDQLASGTRWYNIIGPVDNVSSGNHTFFIQCNAADAAAFPAQCPVAGQAFTGFTRGGVAVTNEFNLDYPKLRLSFDPGGNQDFVDPNYGEYGGQTINGLAVLGYAVSNAVTEYNARCGPQPDGAGCYNPARPSSYWDKTIVIPGLPTPINTVP